VCCDNGDVLAWSHTEKNVMIALPSRCYCGHHKAAREQGDQEYLEKGSGARNVIDGLQVQLEKDGDGSTRESWMVTSGLCTVIHMA